MTTTLTTALTYARLGLRIVPIKPGTKHPAVDDWPRRATTDEGLISDWYTAWPDHGIGIVTGEGVLVLDVDISDGKLGDDTLAELEAIHGPLPETAEVITGSGGRHLYFTYPAHLTLTNSAGRLGPGLDIRAEGGQVVAPPTVHPVTGAWYEWEIEHDLHDVEMAPAPQWLLDLCAPLPGGVTETGPRGDWQTTPLAWDRFNWQPDATAVAVGLLERSGWAQVRTGRDGEVYVRRPGKAEGMSASVGKVNPGVTYCFTSSSPPLEAERSYDPADLLCLLQHDGDRIAADRAITASMGGIPSYSADQEHWSEPAAMPLAPPPPIGDSDGWPEPLPLAGNRVVPEFPLDVFPPWVRDDVTEIAAEMQVPVDLPAALALATLSALVAGRARIGLAGTWIEPANIYIAVAADPGVGKSPVFRAITAPLIALEATMRDRLADAVRSGEMQRTILEGTIEKANKALQQGTVPQNEQQQRISDVLTLTKQLDELDVPTMPTLMVEDVTPEALGIVLSNHSATAILSAEGGVFRQALGGRYTQGPATDLDLYLKAHSGDPYRVHRVKRDPIELVAPLLTIGVTVQPTVLEELGKNKEMVERGMVARFILLHPQNRVGRRNLSDSVPITQASADGWSYGLGAIDAVLPASSAAGGALIGASPEAIALHLGYRQDVEDRMTDPLSLGAVPHWAAKLGTHAARFALLSHLMANTGASLRGPVGLDSMAKGVALCRYAEAHAISIYEDVMEAGATGRLVSRATRLASVLAERGQAVFTKTDAYRASSSRNREELDAVMTLLLDTGWVREARTEKHLRAYTLHPRLRDATTAKDAADTLKGNRP